jgi:hypothetical protein
MSKHSSATGALDGFFAVVREQADKDPAFAAKLLSALNIPVEVIVETPADVKAKMLHLDPYVIAKDGYEHFRSIFTPLKDAQRKAIIKHYNIADLPTGSGAPKGEALIEILWEGAQSKRKRSGV